MKLFYAAGACSLSPHIVLRELGLQHSLDKVDLKAKKTESGADFLALNPKGYVPALQLDNGEVLSEGVAIVQYLASLKPDTDLVPTGLDRFRLLEWLNYISTEVHKSFGPLFAGGTEEARNKLQSRLNFVADHLKGKDFLVAGRFTLADAYLYTVLTWADHVKVDLPEILKAYRDRIAARPAVREALQAEGLLAAAH